MGERFSSPHVACAVISFKKPSMSLEVVRGRVEDQGTDERGGGMSSTAGLSCSSEGFVQTEFLKQK